MTRSGIRSEFLFEARYATERYETSPLLNRTIAGVELEFSRRIRPTVTFSLETRYDQEHYESSGVDIPAYSTTVSLAKLLSSRFSVEIHYQNLRRSSDLSAGKFSENRYGARLQYLLLTTGRD